MDEKFSISAKVLKKLRAYKPADKEPLSGLLYGLRSGGEALVCSYYSFEESGPKYFLSQFDEAAKYHIEGIQPIGFFLQSPQAFMHAAMLSLCHKYFPTDSAQHDCFNGKDILLMSLLKGSGDDDDDEKKCFFYKYNAKSQDLKLVEIMEATEEAVKKMRDRFTLFNIQAKLPISIHHSKDFEDKRLSVNHSFNQLANQLAHKLTIFKLPNKKQKENNKQQQQQQSTNKQQQSTNKQKNKENRQQQTNKLHQNKYFLIRNTYTHKDDDNDDDYSNEDDKNDDNDGGNDGNSSSCSSPGGGVRMVDIYDVIDYETLNIDGYEQKVTKVELLLQTTGSLAKPYYLNSAPVLYHDHLNLMLVTLTIPLNVAVLVANDDVTITMSNHFLTAINKQLKGIGETLYCFSRSSVYYIPKAYHYSLLDNFITILYPEGIEEKQLKETRKNLHHRFLIPLSSPFFKRSKQTHLSPHSTNPHLTNVHIGLPPSKVKGTVSVVKGSYEYRHYMQDKCNDDGWGCAYRSLQTIASWLNLQGFSEKNVPTHLQIQQALVEVGDKLPSFLGSKEWIGSTEVSYVLDQIYGVQCKICHVSSGSEMDSKVREIVHHFETQGSPIMIGGGTLAHTIIGVDFNEETGNVAYLILDPHYTGAEDIKTIQDKGWCGWKGGDFWNQTSFHNMCMPVKPSIY